MKHKHKLFKKARIWTIVKSGTQNQATNGFRMAENKIEKLLIFLS